MDLEKLQKLYLEGMLLSDLAKEFNVSLVTIRNYINKLDLPLRNPKVSKDTIALYTTLYKQGKSCNDIGLLFGKSSSAVNRVLKSDMDLRKKDFIRGKINHFKEQIPTILKIYIESDRATLAKYLDLTYDSVGHVLKGLGLATKENYKKRLEYKRSLPTCYNPFNVSVFNKDSAYILGYILGDGCIRSKHKNDNYYLNISSKDYHILLDILKVFKSPENKISKSFNKTGSYWYSIDIRDEPIIQDLLALGIRPRKSKEGCTLRDIPITYYPHFIRGLFDSDGCVRLLNKSKKATLQVSICGHSSYLLQVYTNLLNQFDCKFDERPTLSHLNFYKQTVIFDLYHYLYNDATLFLSRKKRIFDEYFTTRGYKF